MIGKLLGHTKVETTTRNAQLARDLAKTAGTRVVVSPFADAELPPGALATS